MAKKSKKASSSGYRIYGSYTFKDKDPQIDILRGVVEKEFGERVSHKHLSKIESAGGPTATCMSQWFFGTTKRPQNATLEAAGRALGWRREWVRDKK